MIKKSSNQKMLKKSMSMIDTLVKIVLILLVMVAMMVILSQVYTAYKKYSDARICEDSVRMNADARIKVLGKDMTSKWGQVAQLRCSTDYQKITSKEEDKKKKSLADAVDKCWMTYHGPVGKGYELFDTNDNTFCVVCSRLDYEDKKPIKDFSKYIMTTKKGNETYFKRLYGADAPLSSIQTAQDTFNLDKPLGITYIMKKKAENTQGGGIYWGAVAGVTGTVIGVGLTATGVFAEVGIPLTAASLSITSVALVGTAAVASGAGIGYAVGSDESSTFTGFVQVFPYDNIKDLNCTYLEGRSTNLEVIEKEAQI